MKIIKKIGVILLSICLAMPVFGTIAQAASGRISISSPSGRVGSTVTVTCNITSLSGDIGSADVVVTYDQSGLQYVSSSSGTNGGGGSVQYAGFASGTGVKSLSFTMKFKILKEGSFAVSSTRVDAYNMNEEQLGVSNTSGRVRGTVNTSVEKPEDNRDQNNKLASLEPSVGTLEPAFQADVTTYKLTVPEETTEVTFTATAQSNKAQVAVSGGTGLRLGENAATVTVTAENGTTLAYNITILCGEAEKIQIGDVQYTFNYDFTDEQIPVGFTRTKVIYNEREYEAVANANESIQLVSLQNGETADFYIYKEETKEFLPFVQIIFSEGKYIVPITLKSEMEQFAESEKTKIAYSGKQFEAWKLDDEFSIVCVMNEEGKELLYRYDSVDGVFQRYVEQKVEEKTIFPNEYYMYAIIGLGALVLILLIAVICLAVRKKGTATDDINCEDEFEPKSKAEPVMKHEPEYAVKPETKNVAKSEPQEAPKREPMSRKEKAIARIEKKRAREQKKLEKKNKKNMVF